MQFYTKIRIQVMYIACDVCGKIDIRDGKCIFHLEDKLSDEEINLFKVELQGYLISKFKNIPISIEGNIILIKGLKSDQPIDFKKFIFPIDIKFESCTFFKPIYFNESKFKKKAFFLNIIFKEDADFCNIICEDDIDFSGSSFCELGNFTMSIFKKAIFKKATFNRAEFKMANFNNETDFLFTKFKEVSFMEANFNGNNFNGNANFSHIEFLGEADFDQTRFNCKLFFNYDQFYGKVSFTGTDENFIFGKYKTDFINVIFHKPKDVKFHNIALSNVSFLNTDITDVEFLDIKWNEKNNRYVLIDELQIGKDTRYTYDKVMLLYRRFRMNYEKNYRFVDAGKFFIGEMEIRRLYTNSIFEKIILYIYKHLSNYGEDYRKPFICAAIVIASYPILISLFLKNPLVKDIEDYFFIHLRNSFASFFQIGNIYIGERIISIPIIGSMVISLKRGFERK